MDDRRAEVRGQRKPSNHPRRNQHSPGTPTTGLHERGNDTSKSTGRSGRQNAATRRNMRREERVTVQGPVKEEQPDGTSHKGVLCQSLQMPTTRPLSPYPACHSQFVNMLKESRRIYKRLQCGWKPRYAPPPGGGARDRVVGCPCPRSVQLKGYKSDEPREFSDGFRERGGGRHPDGRPRDTLCRLSPTPRPRPTTGVCWTAVPHPHDGPELNGEGGGVTRDEHTACGASVIPVGLHHHSGVPPCPAVGWEWPVGRAKHASPKQPPPYGPLSARKAVRGAYRALCEKLAVLHHREFGKFRRLKGRH